jgi:hypothetical protein
MINSTIVTNDAMITTYAGMRTLSGINDFTSDTTRFDMTKTKVVAKPMPMALLAEVVVPRVGHMPSMITKMGFSVRIPFKSI